MTRRVKHDLKDTQVKIFNFRATNFESFVVKHKNLVEIGQGCPLSVPSNILVFVVICNYAVSGNRPFMITVVDQINTADFSWNMQNLKEKPHKNDSKFVSKNLEDFQNTRVVFKHQYVQKVQNIFIHLKNQNSSFFHSR